MQSIYLWGKWNAYRKNRKRNHSADSRKMKIRKHSKEQNARKYRKQKKKVSPFSSASHLMWVILSPHCVPRSSLFIFASGGQHTSRGSTSGHPITRQLFGSHSSGTFVKKWICLSSCIGITVWGITRVAVAFFALGFCLGGVFQALPCMGARFSLATK